VFVSLLVNDNNNVDEDKMNVCQKHVSSELYNN